MKSRKILEITQSIRRFFIVNVAHIMNYYQLTSKITATSAAKASAPAPAAKNIFVAS